jgi:hypothetical protein
LLFATSAFGDEGTDVLEVCASAAERGQVARHEGKLLEARDAFRTCDAAVCPAVVRADCTRWNAELEEETPSVVLRARDSRGQEVIDVRVYANQQIVTNRLDGEAIALDPGRYDFRFDTASGAAATETVLVALGERRREVTGTFSMPLNADGTALSLPAPPSAVPPSPRFRADADAAATSRGATGPSPLAYVFAGVSAASLGAFGYFELSGQSGYSDLQGGCGRTRICPASEVDPVRTDFVAAGSFLAAAVVFAGLATWQFLTPHRPAVAGWLQTPSVAARAVPVGPLVRF